jgi:hypothetical protein
MIIGFTGTRKGMTPRQQAALNAEIMAYPDAVWIHGGALGADSELDRALTLLGRPTEIYPAERRPWTGNSRPGLTVHSSLPPLKRNRIIARLCDRLVACPAEDTPQTRGGTWYTVRRAYDRRKSILLILPDGTLKEQRDNNTLLITPPAV